MTGLIVFIVVLAIVAWVALDTVTMRPKKSEPEHRPFDFKLAPDLGPVRAERIIQRERDKQWEKLMEAIK